MSTEPSVPSRSPVRHRNRARLPGGVLALTQSNEPRNTGNLEPSTAGPPVVAGMHDSTSMVSDIPKWIHQLFLDIHRPEHTLRISTTYLTSIAYSTAVTNTVPEHWCQRTSHDYRYILCASQTARNICRLLSEIFAISHSRIGCCRFRAGNR